MIQNILNFKENPISFMLEMKLNMLQKRLLEEVYNIISFGCRRFGVVGNSCVTQQCLREREKF